MQAKCLKAGQACCFGLPLGRGVVSSPNRTTLLRTHWSFPKGIPLRTEFRSASSSASASGVLTQVRQSAGNDGLVGVDNQRRSEITSNRAWAELHIQSSPRSTKFARPDWGQAPQNSELAETGSVQTKEQDPPNLKSAVPDPDLEILRN
jgi:hypothetical protein